MKIALREAVDGEADVELDLGVGGHRHELAVEEQLHPRLLDVVHEALVGGVGGGGHGHAHGGDVDPETGVAKENINVRAAFIHVVGDFLQSLGVFIAALIIYF